MVVTKTVQSKNMRSSNASNLSNPDAHLARVRIEVTLGIDG